MQKSYVYIAEVFLNSSALPLQNHQKGIFGAGAGAGACGCAADACSDQDQLLTSVNHEPLCSLLSMSMSNSYVIPTFKAANSSALRKLLIFTLWG